MGGCQSVKSIFDPKQSRENFQNTLLIKSQTWNRDSHGLFDYECKQNLKQDIQLNQSCMVIRENNLIKQDYQDLLNKNLQNLVYVDKKDNEFWIVPEGFLINDETHQKNQIMYHQQLDGSGDQSAWLIVKFLKQPRDAQFKLQVGDYIKLGRVRFRVKEINLKGTIQPKECIQDDDQISQVSRSTVQELRNSCRICLSERVSLINPFVNPCSCDGTMKNIHIKCLQKWLQSKLQIQNTKEVQSFIWKNFECELCKAIYPDQIMVNNQMVDTLQIPTPKGPFIMLEVLCRDKNTIKGIHVVGTESKNTIQLGRGHDSDIRISDISVSRVHAIIKQEKDGFYISDNQSKFGTLVLIKSPIQLQKSMNNLGVQVGRSILNFKIVKKWNFFSAKSQIDQKVNQSLNTFQDPDDNQNLLTDRELDDQSIPLNQLNSIEYNDNLNQAFDDDDAVNEENQIERVNPDLHPIVNRQLMNSIVNEEEESRFNQ